MYAVVTQQDSDVVIVAASNWLSEDKKQCYWPPFKSLEKCMEAVQNRIKPETGGKPWEKLNISFYREYGTFDKAKEGQKEIKEQKERSFLLATGFSGIKDKDLKALKEYKDELFQMLRDIKSMVQGNSVMLKKLLKDKDSEVPISTSIPSKDDETKLNLPLTTFKDVARTERELSNPTTRQKYVNYLSMLGGIQPKFVIKNIMQQVLSDDLARQFNRRGRGDKKPFSELILTDVIRDAASKQSIMRDECETEIKNYLSCIADRIGRKRPIE
ncbi:hypothetical protein G5714_023103 [Onychostoma macrolepis]|uniref:DUF4806 domain-containing protein n=1 Tax=Onychostoma macrolepis TaxID=369639 RepID=A0A7J6BK48_9TELE|nr:hypothetical protein G5714_023103 [Onychostoma macrolepis]